MGLKGLSRDNGKENGNHRDYRVDNSLLDIKGSRDL